MSVRPNQTLDDMSYVKIEIRRASSIRLRWFWFPRASIYLVRLLSLHKNDRF